MTEIETSAEINTYSGRVVRPLQLRAEDVDIVDIAHSLAMTCRFNGHTRGHYSVAQHSIVLSRIVPSSLAFYALLHDAAEAYVHDVVRPLKPLYRIGGHSFDTVEARILEVILLRYGLGPRVPSAVMIADSDLTRRELHGLLHQCNHPVFACEFWTWQEAETAFLSRFDELSAVTAA